MVQAYSKNELVEKASEWVVREEDVRVLGWGIFPGETTQREARNFTCFT